MPETHSSRAVVLRWRAYGDSDKIATLLSEDFGKLTGIAKGARNSHRRFPNSLEPLARVRVRFRQRPGAGLAFLESAELLAPTTPFAEPVRFAYGSYLIELADRMTLEDEPARDRYSLLAEALDELERGPATTAFLRAFELQLLSHAGFEPQLERCARCQRAWRDDETAWLSLHHGTLACGPCRPTDEAPLEVAAALLARLERLKSQPLASARATPFTAMAAEAALLTGRLLALHLARPLQSVKLIEQLARADGSGRDPVTGQR